MDLLLDIIGAAVDRSAIPPPQPLASSWQSGPSHTTPASTQPLP
jgi:hypothetical protein